MKALISTLIAVSVLGLVVPPASAFDAKQFWTDYDRTHSNG